MDPIKAKFFQITFEIEHKGNLLQLRGLASEIGITKIFLSNGLPDYWKPLLGQKITVKIDPFEVPGVLYQQQVEHGTFFEIKFRQLVDPVREYLRQRIADDGISPGWQRKFPRIPVKGLDDPELPVPNLCMVRFVGQEVFVNVMNFTLGGLRIETLGDSLGELRVGSTIHFDLITSTGEVLANLNGEVRNIAVHEGDSSGSSGLTRSFGLRFMEMDAGNEKKYKNLIRDYCLILQKRFSEGG